MVCTLQKSILFGFQVRAEMHWRNHLQQEYHSLSLGVLRLKDVLGAFWVFMEKQHECSIRKFDHIFRLTLFGLTHLIFFRHFPEAPSNPKPPFQRVFSRFFDQHRPPIESQLHICWNHHAQQFLRCNIPHQWLTLTVGLSHSYKPPVDQTIKSAVQRFCKLVVGSIYNYWNGTLYWHHIKLWAFVRNQQLFPKSTSSKSLHKSH